ncbi:hypothetical protein D3C80_1751150 [compost metagenome]
MAALADHGPLPLFQTQGRALLDPIERGVARAAEDGELGHVLVADHGVVAPLPGGDHAAIDPQHQPQLRPIKEDRTGLRRV